MKSPLASTVPPAITLAQFRALAKKHRSGLPPQLIVALKRQMTPEAARELDTLFDPVTGRPRS